MSQKRGPGNPRATRVVDSPPVESAPTGPPSLRARRPVVYWVAVLAVLGLILGTFAGVVFALGSGDNFSSALALI